MICRTLFIVKLFIRIWHPCITNDIHDWYHEVEKEIYGALHNFFRIVLLIMSMLLHICVPVLTHIPKSIWREAENSGVKFFWQIPLSLFGFLALKQIWGRCGGPTG